MTYIFNHTKNLIVLAIFCCFLMAGVNTTQTRFRASPSENANRRPISSPPKVPKGFHDSERYPIVLDNILPYPRWSLKSESVVIDDLLPSFGEGMKSSVNADKALPWQGVVSHSNPPNAGRKMRSKMRTLLVGMLLAAAFTRINSQNSEDRDSFETASDIEAKANSEWEDAEIEDLTVKKRSAVTSNINKLIENIDHLLPVDIDFGSRHSPKIQGSSTTVPPGNSATVTKRKTSTKNTIKPPLHVSVVATTVVITSNPTTPAITSTTLSTPISLTSPESTPITENESITESTASNEESDN